VVGILVNGGPVGCCDSLWCLGVGRVDDGMRQRYFSSTVLEEVSVARSGDHGEDPGPTCHKVLVSSLADVYFIGSKSIPIRKGVLPNLGMAVMLPSGGD
jgi:hypothetical protein